MKVTTNAHLTSAVACCIVFPWITGCGPTISVGQEVNATVGGGSEYLVSLPVEAGKLYRFGAGASTSIGGLVGSVAGIFGGTDEVIADVSLVVTGDPLESSIRISALSQPCPNPLTNDGAFAAVSDGMVQFRFSNNTADIFSFIPLGGLAGSINADICLLVESPSDD